MTKTFIISSLLILATASAPQLGAQGLLGDKLLFEEDFEDPFSSGKFFLPNWEGNRMIPGIMGQHTEAGNSSLYMIPEGEEMPTIAKLSLNLSGTDHVYLTFKVATRKNGSTDDRKRTKLSVAVSTDGGRTFSFGKKIGSEMGFENIYSDFETFEYPLPPVANGQSNVVIRFQGKAGGGPHLASKILIDDVVVMEAPYDRFPPFITGEVSPSSLRSIQVNFSEPLSALQAENPRNYVFEIATDAHHLLFADRPTQLPKVSSASLINDGYGVLLGLSISMEQGEYYTFRMNNICDLAGNYTDFVIDELVHNVPNPGDLIISEVFFHDPGPAHPMQKLQFVEIFNPSSRPIPLGGLRIKGAIAAHNMPNVKLYPGRFWVVTRNAEAFEQTFGFPAWEWKGSWIQYEESHEGNPIENQELYIQTTLHHGADYVDHVSFNFADPDWAALNMAGYSMELCNLSHDNSYASNWSLADEEGRSYDYPYSPYRIYATPKRPRAGKMTCGANGEKVMVCHQTPFGYEDLCIDRRDLFYHILHGDFEGSCEGTCDNEVGFRSEAGEEALPVTDTYLDINPNPLREMTTISISPDLGIIRQIDLYGLNGKQLRRMENINQAVFTFYTNGLAAGIYMLRIRTELGSYAKRIVIQ